MRFAPELPAVLALKTSQSVERNKHLIRRLEIQNSAYEKDLSSTFARDKVIGSVLANSNLTTLITDRNSIGESEVQALSEALKTNSTLTTLGLKYNSIGDNGAAALSEALKTNSTLTTLGLNGNSIGPNGAVALSVALKTNSTLTDMGATLHDLLRMAN
ncbi:hypothetical protein KI688_003463 [Linnemannia hyalina]|uniref:RNI-like protein n=1 Tax=Linnemannia hyalina TaxID=64524 RepID=A0A9P7XMY6_9FUNG|nr:hypothetical protein KI688_003463 [Linnemannia hyalina]